MLLKIKFIIQQCAPCILRTNILQRPGGTSLDFKCRFYSKRGHARFQYVVYVVRHRLKSSSSVMQRKEDQKMDTRELAGSSQNDNKNRKKQVFFLLEGNAQKSLQAKEKKRTQAGPAGFSRNFKNLQTSGAIFLACFKNPAFPYKRVETTVVYKFFSGRKMQFRT
jgi:hypothetical protein